jgi:hypothetical protein
MNWTLFLAVLITIESGGDKTLVGDLNLKNHAYGVCQIRQPYLDDVNRFAGTHYLMRDVAESETLAKWAVLCYVKHYGEEYTRVTGKPLDMEAAARMHNGGGNGWRRKSTDVYWEKFSKELAHASDQVTNQQ